MKLSDAQLQVLRAIDAGERNPKAERRTLISLWRGGLIADVDFRSADVVSGSGISTGWRLTNLGRASLNAGRLMVSHRTQE